MEELADGICSPSYLSRIEQNKVVPGEEFYNLLETKLGIHYLEDQEEERLNAMLDSYFKLYFAEDPDLPLVAKKINNSADQMKGSRHFIKYLLFTYFFSSFENKEIQNELKKYQDFMKQEEAELYEFSLSLTMDEKRENGLMKVFQRKARGIRLMDQHHYLKAYEALNEALDLAVENRAGNQISSIYNMLGFLCMYLDPSCSQNFFESAIYFAQNQEQIDLARYNLACMYFFKTKYEEANILFDQLKTGSLAFKAQEKKVLMLWQKGKDFEFLEPKKELYQCLEQNNMDKALGIVRSLWKEDPDHLLVQWLYKQLLIRNHHFKELSQRSFAQIIQ
ncbi:helix-turn-helix domain-containing protein [Dubosiella newyorkensis]|uniref:helix-turn-helix domain-containing protein n=1 Tax=Dubosiella newyorkensis TaxID=1862672 RepID=UPI0034E48E50